MPRKTLMLLALGLVLAPVLHAQTVDEILARHYEARGGLEKLKALNSKRVTETTTGPLNDTDSSTVERKRPAMFRTVMTTHGMTRVYACDGRRTWVVFPLGQSRPKVLNDQANKESLVDSDIEGPLVDYQSKGHTVELMGKEPVEGGDAYKLKVTKSYGKTEYDFLDAKTYLLVRTDTRDTIQNAFGDLKGAAGYNIVVDSRTTFSDYKDVDGYMEPFSMVRSDKGSPPVYKTTISKIELNVPLDDSLFAVPADADSTYMSEKGTTKKSSGKKKH